MPARSNACGPSSYRATRYARGCAAGAPFARATSSYLHAPPLRIGTRHLFAFAHATSSHLHAPPLRICTRHLLAFARATSSHLHAPPPRICTRHLIARRNRLAGATSSVACSRCAEAAGLQVCDPWKRCDELAGYLRFKGGAAVNRERQDPEQMQNDRKDTPGYR
jgi:hypothetical protein